jgi:hypothetical protein
MMTVASRLRARGFCAASRRGLSSQQHDDAVKAAAAAADGQQRDKGGSASSSAAAAAHGPMALRVGEEARSSEMAATVLADDGIKRLVVDVFRCACASCSGAPRGEGGRAAVGLVRRAHIQKNTPPKQITTQNSVYEARSAEAQRALIERVYADGAVYENNVAVVVGRREIARRFALLPRATDSVEVGCVLCVLLCCRRAPLCRAVVR